MWITLTGVSHSLPLSCSLHTSSRPLTPPNLQLKLHTSPRDSPPSLESPLQFFYFKSSLVPWEAFSTPFGFCSPSKAQHKCSLQSHPFLPALPQHFMWISSILSFIWHFVSFLHHQAWFMLFLRIRATIYSPLCPISLWIYWTIVPRTRSAFDKHLQIKTSLHKAWSLYTIPRWHSHPAMCGLIEHGTKFHTAHWFPREAFLEPGPGILQSALATPPPINQRDQSPNGTDFQGCRVRTTERLPLQLGSYQRSPPKLWGNHKKELELIYHLW